MKDDLEYPNLSSCAVRLTSAGAGDYKPPVHLPRDCLNAANNAELSSATSSSYDFALEREILKKKRDQQKSAEEIEALLLQKQK